MRRQHPAGIGSMGGGSSAPAVVTMEWVTEYDWTPASDGTVDLNALDGSTYEDGETAVWSVSVDGAASAPSFGIDATDGLGITGTASAADVYAYLGCTLSDLIAVGGGPAYDPHSDVVEVWVEYAGLSFGANGEYAYVSITHHSGASRYDGIGRWISNVARRGSVDDNTSAASVVTIDDATFGADGVFAWRVVGTEIGCGYSASPTMGDDFDALTENVAGNRYLACAVRNGAGDSDAADPLLQILFVAQNTGATTQRVTRIRVRRWRGVAS